MSVNLELTAEEWKKKYEKEKEKSLGLGISLQRAEGELKRWRKGLHLCLHPQSLVNRTRALQVVCGLLKCPSGEVVPVEEQQNSRKKKSSAAAVVTDSLAPPPVALSDEERSQYEALITSLYQQLDDKVSPCPFEVRVLHF